MMTIKSTQNLILKFYNFSLEKSFNTVPIFHWIQVYAYDFAASEFGKSQKDYK